ncbi:hypothetical protein FQA39_LY09799 [Lamprigera yunnana]|nr:hypothetical protein FQA39_LY09799 [Lamprigera yunnana]
MYKTSVVFGKNFNSTIIKSKLTKTEKILQEQKEIKTKPQIEIKPKIENRIVEENIKNGQTNEPTTEIINGKISDDKISGKVKPKVRTEKLKPEMRVYKTIKAAEKKQKSQIEKKASPTTPKKVVEAKINGDALIKSRTAVPAKTSSSSTQAKSAKDANNRKVVESKYKAAPKKDVSKSAKKKKPNQNDIVIEKDFKSEETDKPEHDKEDKMSDKIEVDECAYKKDKVLLESIPSHEFRVDKEPVVLSEIIEVDFKSQDELSKRDENNKNITLKIKTDVDEIGEAKTDDHKDISEERKVEDIEKDGEDKTELPKEESTPDISLKEELKEKAEKEILEKTIDDKAKVRDIEKSENKPDDKVDEELIYKTEKQPLEMDANISKGEDEALPDEFQQESKLSDAVAKDEIKETEVTEEDNKTLMKEIEDERAETIEAKEIEPKQDYIDTDEVHKAATGDKGITKEVVSKDDIYIDVVDEEILDTDKYETADGHKDGIHKEETYEIPDAQITKEVVFTDAAKGEKEVEIKPVHMDKVETDDVQKDTIEKTPDTQVTDDVIIKDAQGDKKEAELNPAHMDEDETDDSYKDVIERVSDTQTTKEVVSKDAPKGKNFSKVKFNY